jgi:hypothetical protein
LSSALPPTRDTCRYTSCYCEENIWQLATDARYQQRESAVVVVTNRSQTVALWHQRAAEELYQPVIWDYHVILLSRDDTSWLVWDLDSNLDFPVAIDVYLSTTFPNWEQWEKSLLAKFRVIPANEFCELFASDRSHMRDGDSWLAMPPEWPCIGDGRPSNLNRFLELGDDIAGTVMDMQSLAAMYS